MPSGHLREIWQYPLKSAAGVKLERASVTATGMAGDRCWAIVDAASGEIRSAKRWPELLHLRAELLSQPDGRWLYGDEVPELLVTLPCGERVRGRQADANRRLSDFLGREARLEPLAAPDERAHYRLRGARGEAELAADLGLLEGEALPDFSSTPPELLAALAEHATPPGTYFDAYPLHLLTTNSLRYLGERGGVQALLPRFRANLLAQPAASEPALTETQWLGRRLRIGGCVLKVHSETVRCSMPSRAQRPHGLAAQPAMTRAMVEHVNRRLGVNLLVERAGEIRAGDAIRLLD